MPISSAPRSVSDATRFTATTPHASSKAAAPAAAESAGSRFTPPASSPAGGSGGAPMGSPLRETPEQRVKRLRAAHLRAKAAQTSRFDRLIDMGRRVFDSAHKVTVVGLVGLTAITGLITVYTAVDMLAFNKKRRAEFVEAQRAMEADSLEAARLAYMTNKATEEQILMVEEAAEREASGAKIFKMPPVLGAPRNINTESQEAVQTDDRSQTSEAQKSGGGITGWLFGSLKKEEERLGDKPQTFAEQVDDKQAYIRAKAKQAFEQEKENQRNGGPLDRTGLTEQSSGDPRKKGWW